MTSPWYNLRPRRFSSSPFTKTAFSLRKYFACPPVEIIPDSLSKTPSVMKVSPSFNLMLFWATKTPVCLL